jgi:hypothetical protein
LGVVDCLASLPVVFHVVVGRAGVGWIGQAVTSVWVGRRRDR